MDGITSTAAARPAAMRGSAGSRDDASCHPAGAQATQPEERALPLPTRSAGMPSEHGLQGAPALTELVTLPPGVLVLWPVVIGVNINDIAPPSGLPHFFHLDVETPVASA